MCVSGVYTVHHIPPFSPLHFNVRGTYILPAFFLLVTITLLDLVPLHSATSGQVQRRRRFALLGVERLCAIGMVLAQRGKGWII